MADEQTDPTEDPDYVPWSPSGDIESGTGVVDPSATSSADSGSEAVENSLTNGSPTSPTVVPTGWGTQLLDSPSTPVVTPGQNLNITPAVISPTGTPNFAGISDAAGGAAASAFQNALNGTATSTTPLTNNSYNAPAGEGPNQQLPTNQEITPVTPTAVPGSVGSPTNADGTPRDTPETVNKNTTDAAIPTTTPGVSGTSKPAASTTDATTPAPATPAPYVAPTAPQGYALSSATQPTAFDPSKIASPDYVAGGKNMQSAAEASYGSSAADAMRKAMGAGQDYAADQASRSAANAGTQATGFARANGLSPAQAALMAGQQAGTNYNSAYSSNLSDAMNQYRGLASDMGSLGLGQGSQALSKYNTDVSKYGTDVGAGLTTAQQALSKYNTDVNAGLTGSAQDISKWATQLGNDTTRYGIDKGVQVQNQNSWLNGLGGLLSAGAGLLSDERAKTDIKDGYGILEQVTKVVNPKTFKYRPGVGEDSNAPRVGVMAQDLEKTPLASVVKSDPNGLKRVDTGQLTLGNTAMISDLSKKLDSVFDYIKKGAKA